MRILFASANFDESIVGGAQRSVRIVAEQLALRGHEVAVASVDPSMPTRSESATGLRTFKLPPSNVYWHRSPRPGRVKRLLWHANDRFGRALAPSIDQVLDEFRPEVVHSNVLSGLTVSAWTAARARRIPIVHTVHDYYLLCVNSGMRGMRGNCQRPCLTCNAFTARSQRSAKYVASVIYVSQHMRAAHERERVFARDAHVSEIIGAFERQRPAPPRADRSGPLRIGFLGRLAPDKGLEDLLVELRGLDPRSYTLEIGGTGAGGYEAKLRAQAEGMPVKLLGRVETETFFERIDILVVPSRWNEPAGRVVFEAGLCGVPVLVSRRGGLPQMVGFGELGWIYEPDNPGELRNMLQRIHSDRAQVSTRAGRWSARALEFSPAHVSARTLLAYEAAIDVAHKRRPAPVHDSDSVVEIS